MALIKCRDCHNSISDSAKVCPHCGRPLQTKPKAEKTIGDVVAGSARSVWRIPIVFVLLVPVLVIVWFAISMLLETLRGIAENGLGGGAPTTSAAWPYLLAFPLTAFFAGLVTLVYLLRKKAN